MSEVDESRAESPEGDIIEYQPISALAVLSLLVGIPSLLAIVVNGLLPLAIVGVCFGLLAVIRLSAAGTNLAGRTAALLGLSLSLIAATAVPVEWATTRWWLVRESNAVVAEWFDALKGDQPLAAVELGLPPTQRRGLKSPTAQYFRDRPNAREELEQFVADPWVRTLLALHGKFIAQPYEAGEVESDEQHEVIHLYQAVTFDDDGVPSDGKPSPGEKASGAPPAGKQSFFMRFTLERTVNRESRRGVWRIVEFTGGGHPPTEPR